MFVLSFMRHRGTPPLEAWGILGQSLGTWRGQPCPFQSLRAHNATAQPEPTDMGETADKPARKPSGASDGPGKAQSG